MTHYSAIIFCLTLILLTACGSSKSSSSKKYISYQEISLLAWNEDTIHSYQFALTKDHKFRYTILNNEGAKSKEYYFGTFSNIPTLDTIFLKYNRDIRPKGFASYLIKESSGSYLIQPFENDTKRIFLRLQRLGHRF